MDVIGFWNDGFWPFLQGLSSLGPLATFVVAFAAWRTYRQKAAADQPDQGWKRVEWAIGLALTEDRESRLAGIDAITELFEGQAVAIEDERLFTSVGRSVQDEVLKKLAMTSGRARHGLCFRKAGE